MKLVFIAALSCGILLHSAHAMNSYKGSITFTEGEKALHLNRINAMVDAGRSCLLSYRNQHTEYYRSNCIQSRKTGGTVCLSKFYGDRKYSKRKGARRADGTALQWLGYALAEHGWPTSKMNEMRNTSCVGMALDCLGRGLKATGQDAAWQKIRKYVVGLNGTKGTALQHALSRLGWKTMYWNPEDHSSIRTEARKWDAQERSWGKYKSGKPVGSRGWHLSNYNNVMSNRGVGGKGYYWANTIDDRDSLVGFGAQVPSLLYKVPFWIATAHIGYHVFPGTFQDVVEAHSTRNITSRNNLEFSEFNPMSTGGGPRWSTHEKYRSGLVSVPPVY